MESVTDKIRSLVSKYAQELQHKIEIHIKELESDDQSHYLIYKVLEIQDNEGRLIDLYQNKGRFLYKYAGAFLEEATFLCFKERFPHARRAQVENTSGQRPRQFHIDCLIDREAIEIKWRDATTDGDHIIKEHARIRVIKDHGLYPVRVMFFYPNRDQAKRIQETIKTVYQGIGETCYTGDDAWEYVKTRTGIDLKAILVNIANDMQ